MQFYDATNKRAICQEIDRLCDTTDTSYPRLDKTARVNDALEQVVGWILQADGRWQFDDSNYTTLPIGTVTLVEGQVAYSFTDKFLDIEEVAVLDVGGSWRKLIPIDSSELEGLTIEEYFGITASSTPKGLPTHYDKQEDTIKIYLAPTSTAVTLTNGLRVRFKRTASLFTAVSTTAADTTVPGFASPYHVLLAYMAAMPYVTEYKQDRVALYEKKIDALQKEIIKFYGHRSEDERKIMEMSSISFR